jgi:hypothetical protein
VFFYKAYGLTINSELYLPELVATTGEEADIVIRSGKLDCHPPETNAVGFSCHTTTGGAYLSWGRIGTFLVRGGSEIVLQACPGVQEGLIRLPLLGMVLATLLHQRGLLVLHSSAVTLDGGALALVGGKGWGKSTLAAALYARGHGLVADDLLALRVGGAKTPTVLPAYPRFKLWPDAIVALGEDPESFRRVVSPAEKRDFQINSRFSQRPIPLRGIYILNVGPMPEIERVRPQEALIRLIKHSYATRIGKELPPSEEAAHFLQCAALVKKVPVYRLKRPNALQLLPDTVRLVEAHARIGAQRVADQAENLDG